MLLGDGPGFREECNGETLELFALAGMQRTEHQSFGFGKFVDRFRYRSTTLRRKLDAIRATVFNRPFASRKAGRFEPVDQVNRRGSIDPELRANCILALWSVGEENSQQTVLAYAQFEGTKCLFDDTGDEITERRECEIGAADERTGIDALHFARAMLPFRTRCTYHANYLFYSPVQPCTEKVTLADYHGC